MDIVDQMREIGYSVRTKGSIEDLLEFLNEVNESADPLETITKWMQCPGHMTNNCDT
jgi:hypothetical protein